MDTHTTDFPIIPVALWVGITLVLFFVPMTLLDVNDLVVKVVSNVGLVCSSLYGLWLSHTLRGKIMLSLRE